VKKNDTIIAADLFCGAGGASNGLMMAAEVLGRPVELTAVNHWQVAVETHSMNHPKALHLCEDVGSVNPRKAVPGGRLDLLLAGPECTHHSTARGGKPINDQSRASAWCILRWATALEIDTILIENVKEFQTWGPLGHDGRPLRSRKGETFAAFLTALRSLGYKVDWKVFCAADYGDPTTRERLFIQARRGRRPIRWPAPTHSRDGQATLFGPTQRWRPARDIIDWSINAPSIFGRKKPLSPNTIARIAAGLKKFGGAAAEPFLVLLNGGGCQGAGGTRSVEEPLPTITASGEHIAVCEPFVAVVANGGCDATRIRGIDQPLPTVTAGGNRFALVEPFVVPVTHQGDERTHDLRDPLPTVTGAHRGELALVEPFLLPPEGIYRGNAARSVEDPLQTVTQRGGGCLVEPFIMGMSQSGSNGDRARSSDKPLATITTADDMALVQPFIVPTNYGERPGQSPRCHDLDNPLPTVVGTVAHGLVEPYLVKFNGTATHRAQDVEDPLDTITGKDRFGLVETTYRLDIRFRMLQPSELAAAHSFRSDYFFAGNREQRVKQIGNSWPNRLGRALCLAVLS
jgi:DNA (cytosine-5)-methyltransferase 1